MQNRLEALRQRMGEAGADAILISQPNNRRYLTGFTGHDSPSGSSAGWLFVTPTEALLLVGFLSLEQAQRECPDFGHLDTAGKPAVLVGQLAREHSPQRLLCEGSHLTYAAFNELQAQLPAGCELVAVEGWVERQRASKDEGEVAKIQRAAEVTDAALQHVLGIVRPGLTERQLAWEAEKHMREHGAESLAFDVGVAGGPNSSLPHNPPGERPCQSGEPIWIDMGAQVDGYCADLTRTFCLGEPEARLREVWDLVHRAQQAAIAQCRPGMTGREVDSIARDIIAEAGYGDKFGHSLGHGVGLVVHELPRLAQTSSDVLAEGNIVTFEPGVYLEGWGGVRIEDLGVIRGGKVELLSAAPKRLVVG
ncbi:MAG: Xaa-Pro peptidase family protein [Chloroflexi bacterium]|nr:Xaa-Pro peptidase family protein [Chloroflexota bacterium]